MKKLIMFSLILVVSVGMIYSAGITVNSPAGGITWYKGSTHNITWTLSGCASADPNVKINIFKNAVDPSNFIEQLTATTASGSKSWTIAGSYTNGNYVIRVKTNDNACFGDSGVFTITDAPSDPASSITVNTPHSGTDWCKGSTHNILWSSTGITSGTSMKINVFKNSVNPDPP